VVVSEISRRLETYEICKNLLLIYSCPPGVSAPSAGRQSRFAEPLRRSGPGATKKRRQYRRNAWTESASVKAVVEISAGFPDGAKDTLKRAVPENARSLSLKSADCE